MFKILNRKNVNGEIMVLKNQGSLMNAYPNEDLSWKILENENAL